MSLECGDIFGSLKRIFFDETYFLIKYALFFIHQNNVSKTMLAIRLYPPQVTQANVISYSLTLSDLLI